MPKLQMHEMHELGLDGPQEELPQSIQIYDNDNDNDDNNENDKEGDQEERARSSNMHSLFEKGKVKSGALYGHFSHGSPASPTSLADSKKGSQPSNTVSPWTKSRRAEMSTRKIQHK